MASAGVVINCLVDWKEAGWNSDKNIELKPVDACPNKCEHKKYPPGYQHIPPGEKEHHLLEVPAGRGYC